MAYDVDRKLIGTNGSYTYTSVGNAEDLSDILTNIDPDRTKFYSAFGTADPAISTSFEWFTERLRPPQDNAHYEMEEYQFKDIDSQEGLKNWVQHFQGTGRVSDTQNSVKKVFRRGTTEFDAAADRAMRSLADDIEYMLVSSAVGNQETPGTAPARSGGIPYFLQMNEMAATVSTSDNTITLSAVTASNPIDLKTGDFVYFYADTMPTGLTANKAYYIKLTASAETGLKNVFTLHKSLEDAVKGANAVNMTTAGTNVTMVRRNVISKKGADGWALSDLSDVLEMVYRRGGHANQAYMSLANKRYFSKLINAETQAQRDANKQNAYNESAIMFYSDFGTIAAHAHHMYSDARIDILDMQYWDIKYLHKPHEVDRDRLAKTGTYEKYVVEAALGLKGTAPQASGALINISL